MHPSQAEPHMRFILLLSSCNSGFKTIAKTTEALNAKNTPEAKKANRFILMLKSEDTTKELNGTKSKSRQNKGNGRR